MSNIAKAADVIDSALPVGSHITRSSGKKAAKALAGAGLLMPDLPQPDHIFEEGDARWELAPEAVVTTWNNRGNFYYPRVLLDIGDGFLLHLEEARKLAYMLLAAANHAEGAGQ